MQLTDEELGNLVSKISTKYDSYPPYWDCRQLSSRYCRPFIKRSAELINSLNSSSQAKIIDLCGGPGLLGIALSRISRQYYLCVDNNTIRLKWGSLLWQLLGLNLNYLNLDVKNLTNASRLKNKFDFVCLLGWESPEISYSQAIFNASKIIKKGGYFLITYHDLDEIISGGWEFEKNRKYPYSSYSLSFEQINRILSSFGLKIVLKESTFDYRNTNFRGAIVKSNLFPQKLIVAKKIR